MNFKERNKIIIDSIAVGMSRVEIAKKLGITAVEVGNAYLMYKKCVTSFRNKRDNWYYDMRLYELYEFLESERCAVWLRRIGVENKNDLITLVCCDPHLEFLSKIKGMHTTTKNHIRKYLNSILINTEVKNIPIFAYRKSFDRQCLEDYKKSLDMKNYFALTYKSVCALEYVSTFVVGKVVDIDTETNMASVIIFEPEKYDFSGHGIQLLTKQVLVKEHTYVTYDYTFIHTHKNPFSIDDRLVSNIVVL